MGHKERFPVTQAIRFLRKHGIDFVPHLYSYEEHGGTSHASRALNVPEHLFVKTLIMETDGSDPLIVLMHGDKQVSLKKLARVLKVKRVAPCAPATANRHSGYLVGGTSPFGTRHAMPIYGESSIFELDRIFINGGHRGFMLELDPRDMLAHMEITRVSVAIDRTRS